jgi:hypothetical protein
MRRRRWRKGREESGEKEKKKLRRKRVCKGKSLERRKNIY